MTEKTRVEIPFSIFEYSATFTKPIVSAWPRSAEIIQSYLEALQPWGFGFPGVEMSTSNRLADHSITFLQPPSASPVRFKLWLGLGKLTVTVEQPDWNDAENVLKFCQTAIEIAVRVAHAEVAAHEVTLGLHIQSATTPRQEVTARLVGAPARELLDGELHGQGIILYKGDANIIIDNSLAYANALFVRIQRRFSAGVELRTVAETLLADETKLWNILDLEGEL